MGVERPVAAHPVGARYRKRAPSHGITPSPSIWQPWTCLCGSCSVIFVIFSIAKPSSVVYIPTTRAKEIQCIFVDAQKNIWSHLQKWKVAAYDVNVEWKLILLRCGLFDVDAYSDKTICPAHRYKLGLCWTSTRKCCHPLHEGKGKPFRGVNKTTSREVFDRWGYPDPSWNR